MTERALTFAQLRPARAVVTPQLVQIAVHRERSSCTNDTFVAIYGFDVHAALANVCAMFSTRASIDRCVSSDANIGQAAGVRIETRLA